MCYEKRLEKAIRLVKLTGAGKAFSFFNKLPPDPILVNTEDLGGCFATSESSSCLLQAQLRAKHMSNEQLDALLEFYESEIGASILCAQDEITHEFAKRYHALFQLGSRQHELESNCPTPEVNFSISYSASTSVDLPACSFCGERRADENKLVAGPGVFICEKCIHMSCEILKERRGG